HGHFSSSDHSANCPLDRDPSYSIPTYSKPNTSPPDLCFPSMSPISGAPALGCCLDPPLRGSHIP
ncbi:hypothetical protein P7K49_002346, partial [Saguinus oedipus]